ncbi:MAG: OmpA family protein [Bacteroidota bacterium]|nr:OmpA family protein [Bacteroidota bacterium]MDP4215936.1 OmpA family protein [Bacteroidota bacterium]MDP4253987.1 OmpA family protein [Bacteroidota bacterium]MDP4259205.1 OmpA family protein [Bacteroidota bacterium]
MNKSIICLAACLLLTAKLLRAQDTTARQIRDTAILVQDTTGRSKDSVSKPQDTARAQDPATLQDPATPRQPATLQQPAADTAHQTDGAPQHRELDNRWFIAPLLKLQFQDFGMLEKDRKGYLSDANTLPFAQRGNGSFAASAYKNITGRLSISADLGLSFGHVTNDSVLISQTKSKTYNLLNATLFYHLLNAGYRLQPFISAGFNDIISDANYMTAPLGIGVKFNSRKVMVMGQVMYGYAISKNIANSTMYAVGIYLPIKSKKYKQQEEEDKSPYNKKDNAKNDTSGRKIINNFYITIRMDSVLNARNKKKGDGSDDDDAMSALAKAAKKKVGARGDGSTDGSANGDDKMPPLEESRVDTVDGRPVYKYFVYFEFNDFTLNSRAFSVVDKAIAQMRKNPDQKILINGYADDIGTIPQNNYISRRRSQMVFEYMNSRGVASERMTPKFFGKQFQVADNDPNSAWLNRRVEIVVQDNFVKD